MEKKELTLDEIARLDNTYMWHTPKSNQNERYNELRKQGKILATLVLELTPLSREQSIALTKIEEAIMWANTAIARNE